MFAMLCAIWGSTFLVIKVGYGGLGAFNVAGLRFLIAGLLMLPLAGIFRARMPRGRTEWGLVLFVGAILFAADYGLIYWAEQWLESGLTAVLFAVMPLMTAVAAHVYLPNERLTARKLVGSFVAFAGVVVLFGDSLRFDASLALPMLAVVLSAACAAAGSVAAKRHGHALHPAGLNGPAMLVGAGLLFLASLVAGDGLRLPTATGGWLAVIYLGVAGSVVTFLVYFHLLKTWEATTMSYIAIFTPAIALALGFFARGEVPTPLAGVGAILILGGVGIALTRGGRRAAETEPAEA